MTHVRVAFTIVLGAAVALATAPSFAAPMRQPRPAAPLVLDLLPIIPAQSCEGDCEPQRYDTPSRDGSDRDPAFPAGVGGKVSRFINLRTSDCLRYTEIWRIDCLSDTLDQAARAMPNTPDYAEARAEIARAAERLQRIADRYADPKVTPRVRRGTSGRTTARPIVAIRPEAVATANAQAELVVNDLATTLLRSAPDTSSPAQIAAVAASVDNSLVLLRSS